MYSVYSTNNIYSQTSIIRAFIDRRTWLYSVFEAKI